MIKRVFSTHTKFRSPEFENGLNLLVVDRAKDSTDKQTRNSAGKSSLIEIIHFVFGADIEKSSFFRSEVFADCFFNVEMVHNQHTFTVSRTAAKSSKVYFDKRIDIDLDIDIDLERDNELNLYYSSVADWKKAVGKFYFNIPSETGDSRYCLPLGQYSLISRGEMSQEVCLNLRKTQDSNNLMMNK